MASTSVPVPEAEVEAPWPDSRLVAMRVGQFLVDIAIVGVCCYLLSLLLIFVPRSPDGTLSNPALTIAVVVLIFALAVALNVWYWVVRPVRSGGRTLAMEWLNLRVVSLDSTPASATQMGLRLLLLAVDAAFFGLVGVGFMLATPTRQRFGDLLAGTLVIHAPKSTVDPTL